MMTSKKDLKNKSIETLVMLYQGGNIDAFNLALKNYTRSYLNYFMKQFLPTIHNAKDITCEFNLGFMKAAQKFKGDSNVKFTTFASKVIRNTINSYIKKFYNCEKTFLSIDEYVKPTFVRENFDEEDDDKPNLWETIAGYSVDFDEEFTKCNVNDSLCILTDHQSSVIKRCFGIDCDEESLTDIARSTGKSVESVRQTRQRAFLQLGKSRTLAELANYGLCA